MESSFLITAVKSYTYFSKQNEWSGNYLSSLRLKYFARNTRRMPCYISTERNRNYQAAYFKKYIDFQFHFRHIILFSYLKGKLNLPNLDSYSTFRNIHILLRYLLRRWSSNRDRLSGVPYCGFTDILRNWQVIPIVMIWLKYDFWQTLQNLKEQPPFQGHIFRQCRKVNLISLSAIDNTLA